MCNCRDIWVIMLDPRGAYIKNAKQQDFAECLIGLACSRSAMCMACEPVHTCAILLLMIRRAVMFPLHVRLPTCPYLVNKAMPMSNIKDP